MVQFGHPHAFIRILACVTLIACGDATKSDGAASAESGLVAGMQFEVLSESLSNEAGRNGPDTTMVSCERRGHELSREALLLPAYQNRLALPESGCVLWIARATYPGMPVVLSADSIIMRSKVATLFGVYDVSPAMLDRSTRPLLVLWVDAPVESVRVSLTGNRSDSNPR